MMKANDDVHDHTAAFAEAFFIANLLFVGVFYFALWVLYLQRFQQTSVIAQKHLRQCLMASTVSTIIFVVINLFIVMTDGYASLLALFSLEVYFMFVVPAFLVVGLIGFSKAIKGLDFNYPLIGQYAS